MTAAGAASARRLVVGDGPAGIGDDWDW